MFSHLFKTIKIRDMELRNRIILPAMGTRMADKEGRITKRLIHYHEARAKGGCGLNILEVSAVHSPSAPAHFVSISEDSYIEGHQRLTEAIHKAGGKAGIQLWQGSIAVGMDPGAKIFVVNDMHFGRHKIPQITKEEIFEITDCYGKAAKRSVKAGYDCIEFHCAHNYLPHSFLSGGLNRRADEYGGSFENRIRFSLACIRAIRENIPEGMPLFMRISAQDDNLPGGLTIEEVIDFCTIAGEAGVDVLDVSRGNIITQAAVYEVPPIDVPRGFNVENTSHIRKETGMLTIAAGRINAAEQAEEILRHGKADMVIMGRAQLADAEFCNKAESGRIGDIIHCVGCNQGCYDGFCNIAARPFITCLRNPMIGHEEEYKLDKTAAPKNVLIAGGGMAGLEAAMILKQRGHNPVIYEKTNGIGGQFAVAGEAPGKAEMKNAAFSFGEQVKHMCVPIHFNTQVTAELIRREKPDEVILAVGASPIKLKLEGIDLKPVYSAYDVLKGTGKPKGKVCVIGGGLVGLETADALSAAGHTVCVAEQKERAGEDLGSLRRIAVMQKMREQKIEIITKAVCTEVTAEGAVINHEGMRRVISCDSIVVAAGSKPNDCNSLIDVCVQKEIPFHLIGDAKQVRKAIDAIAEGFETARKL